MFRFALLVLSLSVASAVFAAPAAANVTGATLTFDQGDAQGKVAAFCPKTLTFSGTITGSPGTPVTYEFYRNGAPSNNVLSGMIGANGQLAVKDSQTFGSSTSNFDQIYVLTNNVYSARVPFALTCLRIVPPLHFDTPTPAPTPAPNLTKSVTLHTGGRWHWWDWKGHGVDCGFLGLGGDCLASVPSIQVQCAGPCVGYAHLAASTSGGREWENIYYRFGIWFDVSALAGRHVGKATLHMHRLSADFNERAQSRGTDCLNDLAMGDSDWWASGVNMPSFEGDTLSVPAIMHAQTLTDIELDVTPFVRAWTDGRHANNGILARGDDENTSDHRDNERCMVVFDADPTLEITYQ